jgi:voltage-dependent calcium channel
MIFLVGFGAYGLVLFGGKTAIASNMNFDNFGNAVFTLFQIMSRRGFTDVMLKAGGMRGSSASQLYSFYFVAFNLLTTIFVLILLLATLIRNATESSGQAILTSDQKSWVGLRALLNEVTPSKRSYYMPHIWQTWCYKQAVRKHGNWYRFITAVLVGHVVLLCLQLGPDFDRWNRAQGTSWMVCDYHFRVNGTRLHISSPLTHLCLQSLD